MFLDKNVSKLVCWYMKSVDVIAFCTIFSLDMKALPVTISWLWSSYPGVCFSCIMTIFFIFQSFKKNWGKSDYQLMQPRTPTFLTTLDSKHVKHLCRDK